MKIKKKEWIERKLIFLINTFFTYNFFYQEGKITLWYLVNITIRLIY